MIGIAKVTLMSLLIAAVSTPVLASQQKEIGKARASYYLQATSKKQKKKKIAADKKQKRKVASVTKKKIKIKKKKNSKIAK